MDFVHDQLIDGRPIRMLTVVDQLSRQLSAITVSDGPVLTIGNGPAT
jgi:hypothetical protein